MHPQLEPGPMGSEDDVIQLRLIPLKIADRVAPRILPGAVHEQLDASDTKPFVPRPSCGHIAKHLLDGTEAWYVVPESDPRGELIAPMKVPIGPHAARR